MPSPSSSNVSRVDRSCLFLAFDGVILRLQLYSAQRGNLAGHLELLADDFGILCFLTFALWFVGEI